MPVPDPARPPARTPCGGRPGLAALDRLPTLVPVLLARTRCYAGPGGTVPGRPPSPGPVQGHRGPPPATIRCSAGPGRTVPARTGPARTVPARTGPGLQAGRPAGTRPYRTGQVRLGTPPRTLAGGARTLPDLAGRGRADPSTGRAVAARTGRAVAVRVRRGLLRRRTVLVPGEPIRLRAPARTHAVTAAPGRPGRTGLPRARSTAASSAGPAARAGWPGQPALGCGRPRTGRPPSARNPLRDRRTPPAADRAGE